MQQPNQYNTYKQVIDRYVRNDNGTESSSRNIFPANHLPMNSGSVTLSTSSQLEITIRAILPDPKDTEVDDSFYEFCRSNVATAFAMSQPTITAQQSFDFAQQQQQHQQALRTLLPPQQEQQQQEYQTSLTLFSLPQYASQPIDECTTPVRIAKPIIFRPEAAPSDPNYDCWTRKESTDANLEVQNASNGDGAMQQLWNQQEQQPSFQTEKENADVVEEEQV